MDWPDAAEPDGQRARVPAFAPLHRAGFNPALQKMRPNRLLVSAKAPRASFPGRLCARINHQALDPGNHRAPLGEPKALKLFWLAMISSPTRAAAAIFHIHRPAMRFRKLFGDGAGGQVLWAAGSKGHDAACGTAGSGFRVCSAYGEGRGNTACQYRAPANGCAIDCFM
jgi:hypothetical protein